MIASRNSSIGGTKVGRRRYRTLYPGAAQRGERSATRFSLVPTFTEARARRATALYYPKSATPVVWFFAFGRQITI